MHFIAEVHSFTILSYRKVCGEKFFIETLFYFSLFVFFSFDLEIELQVLLIIT